MWVEGLECSGVGLQRFGFGGFRALSLGFWQSRTQALYESLSVAILQCSIFRIVYCPCYRSPTPQTLNPKPLDYRCITGVLDDSMIGIEGVEGFRGFRLGALRVYGLRYFGLICRILFCRGANRRESSLIFFFSIIYLHLHFLYSWSTESAKSKARGHGHGNLSEPC